MLWNVLSLVLRLSCLQALMPRLSCPGSHASSFHSLQWHETVGTRRHSSSVLTTLVDAQHSLVHCSSLPVQNTWFCTLRRWRRQLPTSLSSTTTSPPWPESHVRTWQEAVSFPYLASFPGSSPTFRSHNVQKQPGTWEEPGNKAESHSQT